jgi:UDP-glucose 4-epimerase
MKHTDGLPEIRDLAMTEPVMITGGTDPEGQIGEDHDPETHLIPLLLQTVQGRRDYTEVYGTDYDTQDGTAIRDYIHVTDLAGARLLALKYLAQSQSKERRT